MNELEMIDEPSVVALFDGLGAAIEVPNDGPQSILDAAAVRQLVVVRAGGGEADGDADRIERRPTFNRWKLIGACAASLTLVAGTLAAVSGGGADRRSSARLMSSSKATTPVFAGGQGRSDQSKLDNGAIADLDSSSNRYQAYDSTGKPIATTSGTAAALSRQRTSLTESDARAATDQPKLQKNASVDLELRRSTLTRRYDDIQRIAKSNGGYLADGKTDEVASVPRASATIRVPVGRFDGTLADIAQLASPKSGNRVVSRSATSADVTANFADIEARLRAATNERDQVSLVLSKATSIGDILAVRDRLNTVQTEVDRLQGQLNVINDQTAYASIAITLHEQPDPKAEIAATPAAQRGMAKAWADAKGGFSRSVEWIVARSGKALVLGFVILAMLLLIKHLYPIARRTLL